MWKIRNLKQRARAAYRRQYLSCIAVCFLLAFVGAKYADSFSFVLPSQIASAEVELQEQEDSDYEIVSEESHSNWDVLKTWIHFNEYAAKYPGLQGADHSIGAVFDSITTPLSALIGLINRSEMNSFWSVLLVIIGAILAIWWILWVRLVLLAGSARFFLENRANKSEHRISMSAMFVPFFHGNWLHAVKVMFVTRLKQALWALTLIGGLIKHFSYLMVPYILAENPHISAHDAILLSRRMMNGNKMHVLGLGLNLYFFWTFVPLLPLSGVQVLLMTLLPSYTNEAAAIMVALQCLLLLLWVNGYRETIYAELYTDLRRAMREKGDDLSHLFIEPAFND